MPRPKKTTPTIIDPVTTYGITPAKLPEFAHPLPPPHMADDYLKAKMGVATTEPDTTLNPDRAQVAAVADLPRESVGAPPKLLSDLDVPAELDRLRAAEPHLFRAWENASATIAEQSARIATLEKVDHATRTYFSVRLDATQQEVEDAMVREYARVVALGAASDEKDERIAELTAERDAIQHHHDEWMKFRGDADWELANLRRDGREEDRKRIAELEAELVRVALESLTPAPAATRPVATWTGDVLLTPGGKVLGRVNVSRGTFGHLQAAPIYYPAEDQERLGPIGTIETAREWVSDYARKIGWVVV